MSLFLIRHGETDSNRDRILQTPDTPLSELGQQQAQHLIAAFQSCRLSKILCSDYLRTRQTAAPLSAAHECPIHYNELLRERSFGDLRGRHYDHVPTDIFADHFSPPNGETYQSFKNRTRSAWQFVCEQMDNSSGPIAVITHGLVLREWVSNHLQMEDYMTEQATYLNTCVTEVDRSLSKIVRLCDVSHLALLNQTQPKKSGCKFK